MEDSA